VAALALALESDPFWAVRAAAATALGKTRRQDALVALLAASSHSHPKVRRAVAAALGEFRIDFHKDNHRAAERLEAWVTAGDPSCLVEANAALSLGKTRSPKAPSILATALTRPAFQDMIRARSVEGLGQSALPESFSLVEEALRPSSTFQVRRAAVQARAQLGEGTDHARPARDRLEAALMDKDFRVRMQAGLALLDLGDSRALPAIERALAAESDGRTKRRLRQAASGLREKGGPAESTRKLSEEMERLRSETIQLRERLERLEGIKEPAVPTPDKPGPKSTPKRPRPDTHRSGRTLPSRVRKK
jgi:aminopeptidase N